MADYVVNPRRTPRAPFRCPAQLEVGRTRFATETEDVGPQGCQLVIPSPLTLGQAVRVTLTVAAAGAPLTVAAKVAWTSSRAPWRAGLAFDPADHGAASRWWDRLVERQPGLASFRRVPDRLPLDAMVYLAAPPRFTDFTGEELQVLSRVANGTSVADLQERMGDGWGVGRRMLFALLSRGLLTLSKGAASHVGVWRPVLREAGASFQESERPLPSVTRSWLEAVAPRPPAGADRGSAREPPRTVLTPDPRAAAPAPAEAALTPPPAPAHLDHEAAAGNAWRGATHARNADAQRAFELGQAELAGGRARSAVALLRMALQHAPGDAEIATALAKALQG